MPRPSPRQVITLDCHWLNKSKYFLVVGDNPDPLLFYISSNKYALAEVTPELKVVQVQVPLSKHSFLKKDSWINCGEVCKEFSWESIDYQLRNGMGKVWGVIHPDTQQEIMQAVSISETLSTKHQQIILSALSIDRRSI